MIILAIETSCDDTCIAVLEAKGRKNPSFKILSNIVSSQVKIHKKWGGVYPTLAKREHQRNLAPVLKQALSKARLLKSKIKNRVSIYGNEGEEENEVLFAHQKSKIDLIAVTVGPGLEPCLWVGINFARELARTWNLPIIPINHIEAHILANWLTPIGSNFQCAKKAPLSSFASFRYRETQLPIFNFQTIFPAICLVVSGGHTQLILMRSFGKYKILGETRDDAAGECFDKAARILGLGYPGGPAIAAQAAKLKTKNYKSRWQSHRGSSTKSGLITKLPRPMIYQKNYDFSFSGLKTAVLYKVRDMKYEETKKKEFIRAMSREVQQAIIDVLIHKTFRAAKEYKAKTIILGGGVAANEELRKQFKEKIKKEIPDSLFLIPSSQFCTDNAAMIAVTAYFHCLKGETKRWKDIKADANLRII